MRLRPPFRDEALADANRKRQVGEPAAVQVSQLAASDAKLDAAEAVRMHRDAIPAADFSHDTLFSLHDVANLP